jgi:putative oxidoreductase
MHGGQKLFLYVFHNVAGMMTRMGIPLPGVFGVVVTLAEFLGGWALLLGLLTRWVAAALAIEMIVAILKVHLRSGFFLPRGFEFAFSMLAANVALLLAGPGAAAIDSLLGKRRS